MTSRTATGILNELAKSNQIIPDYSQSEESGPPHRKTFKVKLSLSGIGAYEGVGSSIKDAKNAAAEMALQNYTFTGGLDSTNQMIKITPTVELNILAIRAREEVIYEERDPIHVKNTIHVAQFEKFVLQSKRPQAGNRFLRPFIKIWNISVTVCGESFIGQGKTKQEARNNAASSALAVTKHELTIRASKNVISQKDPNVQSENPDDSNDRNKISQLNQIASMNKLKPIYEVITTNGPSHFMRFVVKCLVGDKETIGDGIGKKSAKLEAAKKMLDLLMNTEEIKNSMNSDQGIKGSRQKPGKHRKKKKEKAERTIDINFDPVTYLMQLLQMRKEPAAVYSFVGELGSKLDRKFEIEVRVGDNADLVASGIGSTKKEAKMLAADNLLKKCGIDQEQMREQIRESTNEVKKAYMSAVIGMPRTASNPVNFSKVLEEKPAVQLLNRAPGGPVQSRINWQSSDLARLTNAKKLEYIVTSEGFQIMFNDYSRKNESEPCTTHLAILTAPPVIFQGSGGSVEESHEDAAAKGLSHVAQCGLLKAVVKAEKDI